MPRDAGISSAAAARRGRPRLPAPGAAGVDRPRVSTVGVVRGGALARPGRFPAHGVPLPEFRGAGPDVPLPSRRGALDPARPAAVPGRGRSGRARHLAAGPLHVTENCKNNMKIRHLIAFILLLAATSCASTRKSAEIDPTFVASESTWLYRDAEVVHRRLKPLERPPAFFLTYAFTSLS